MSRMKTFFIYLLLFVGLYVVSNLLIDAYIKQYVSDKKMPTKEELDKRVYLGNLIYVEEYTRSDGTKVSGYYRRFR